MRFLLFSFPLALIAFPLALFYPLAQSPAIAQPSDFLCYLQTSSGAVLDLSHLCGGTSASNAPVATGVIVTDIQLSGTQFRGKVKNQTNTPVTAITISYTVDSPDATNEDLAVSPVEQGILQPQQEGIFRGELTRSGNIKVLAVNWAISK